MLRMSHGLYCFLRGGEQRDLESPSACPVLYQACALFWSYTPRGRWASYEFMSGRHGKMVDISGKIVGTEKDYLLPGVGVGVRVEGCAKSDLKEFGVEV